MKLVEGQFIVTKDGLIFEVKGILQPVKRTIAYLRYVPSENGDRLAVSGVRYEKIYSLEERYEYLTKHYPEYIWKDDDHGRVFQSVHDNAVDFVLNPVDFLSALRDRKRHLSSIQERTLGLVTVLARGSNLTFSDIGITGSQLLGLEKEKSDIDLVVYGETPCRQLFRWLQPNYDDIDGITRYSGELLKKHTIFRWGKKLGKMKIFQDIESEKCLQGLFHGYEFFIRLVRYPQPTDPCYEDYRIIDLGKITVNVDIINDSDKIFTPCEYFVKCDNNPRIKKVMSYRGRFTEQVREGESAVVSGRLEEVLIQSSGMTYEQIVVGDTGDFMTNISDYNQSMGV